MDPKAMEELEKNYKVALLVRVALLASLVFYVGVLFLLPNLLSSFPMDKNTALKKILLPTFAFVSLALLSMMKIIPSLLIAQQKEKPTGSLLSTASIIKGALGESIAVFGLVYGSLAGEIATAIAFLAASACAQLLTLPKKEEWKQLLINKTV